ncbi:sodium:proton antiporter [Salinifilum ghardaiensis]
MIATGALAAAGVYLLLQGQLVRVVVGFLLFQHAVNLLLVTARTAQRDEPPILPAPAPADPLGQAFVLTAIVVGFGSVLFVLALALRYRDAVITEQDPAVPGTAGTEPSPARPRKRRGPFHWNRVRRQRRGNR